MEISSVAELCPTCQKIKLIYPPVSRGILVRQYDKFSDLCSAAATGRRFCTLILRVVEAYYDERRRDHAKKDSSKNIECRIICEQLGLNIRVDCRTGVAGTFTSASTVGSSKFFYLGEIYTEPDSVLAPFVPQRPVALDPESEAVNALVDGWIQQCYETHSDCPKVEDVQLPTRIIDVGPGDGSREPFLFIPPRGFKSRYLALSYCWGKGITDYVLTGANLEQKKTVILSSTLPKTLQDAIKICRRLKFAYIWIDALCIVQDSFADWRREAASMGNVYSLAALTISATAAADCRQGIFNLRRPRDPADAPLVLCGPNGIEGQVFIRRLLVVQNESHDGKNELDFRCWTLQEAVLSARNLSYAGNYVKWGCRSAVFGEGMSPDMARAQLSTLANLPERELLNRLSAGQEWNKRYDQPTDLRRCWWLLVDDYTSRSLTNPSDRLPALAGLASICQTAPDGDEYLFGIWKYQMPWALLWTTSSRTNLANADRRPSGCAAPSWSWASVTGKVHYLNFEPSEKAYCQVTRTTATEGIIEIQGLLMEGQIFPLPSLDDRNTTRRLYGPDVLIPLNGKLPSTEVGFAYFDDYAEMKSIINGSLWYLKVTGTKGLILAPHGLGEAHFKRVGRYKTPGKTDNGELKETSDWFRNCKEQILMLV